MTTGRTSPNGATSTILSINFNHDGAGVLLVEGRIAGYLCTERTSRKKKHPGLRETDLDDLLEQAGATVADIDHVMLCNLHNMDTPDIPRLHGSDLKDTWLEFWINQRNDTVRLRGREIPCTVNPDHHTLHAAAAYYTSPFDSGVSLAIDPLGCRAFAGKGERLYPLARGYDDWFNANYGYGHVAEELFGSSILGAGKVMGLAPYGRPERSHEVDWPAIASFAQLMELASIDPVFVEVAGRALNATLAFYVQRGLELQLDAVLQDLAGVCARNGIPLNLCLSGGTALNVTANRLCFERSDFKALHLHPACGDDGTAIGAALWHWHHVLRRPRRAFARSELMYAVRCYGHTEIIAALESVGDRVSVLDAERGDGDCALAAARLIAGGAVVGWFEGAGEVGPRALGHRSILADPRDPEMRDHLNSHIKHREHFRPFAPSVLKEHALDWFGLRDSPFMLQSCQVLRDGVPAITHVDGTSRIQTVTPGENGTYHRLVSRFHEITGVPMVLNTSLNTKGEPMAESPRDAVRTLLDADLNYLVFSGDRDLIVENRASSQPIPSNAGAQASYPPSRAISP
jgi:carbamoyltransferase